MKLYIKKRSFIMALASIFTLAVCGTFSSLSAATEEVANTSEVDSDLSQLKGRYFVQFWSYDGPKKLPKNSHTFAAFYSGDDLAAGQNAPTTISWLPHNGVVRPVGTYTGRNFSLKDTLALACKSPRKIIRSWGPYEITPELYRRALNRVRHLESGRVDYSMLGLAPKTMNCIKAAGDLLDEAFYPGAVWGAQATGAVVKHLSPLYRNGTKVNKAVAGLIQWQGCP